MTTSMHTSSALSALIINLCLYFPHASAAVPPIIADKNHPDVVFFNASLNCFAYGSDPKTYLWTLPDNTTRNTTQNSSYVPEVDGPHQCTVRNEAGVDISNVIHVRRPQCTSFERFERDQSVAVQRKVDDYVVFECQASLKNCQKTWIFKKEHHPISFIKANSRIFITEEGTLIILRIEAEDSGEYLCEAYDATKTMMSTVDKYFLSVSEAPHNDIKLPLAYKSNDTIIEVGSKLTVYCIFSKSNLSEGNSVKWDLPNRNSQFGNGSLIINTTNDSDSGNFSCTYKEHSYHVNIDVRVPPICKKFSNKNITRGHNVSFICVDVRERPHFRLHWFINGTPSRQFDNKTEIYLQNLQSSCVVTVNISNGLVNRFQSAYVMVNDYIATSTRLTTTNKATSTDDWLPTSTSHTVSTATSPTTNGFANFHINHSLTTTLHSPAPFIPEGFFYIALATLGAAAVLIGIVAICCFCRRKFKMKSKMEQSATPLGNGDGFVVANDIALNNVQPPLDEVNNQLVNRAPVHVVHDEDSSSVRSSDSGFSDPTNEPLLKSNEQLNAEDKSKSDSDHTIAENNERPYMSSVGVC